MTTALSPSPICQSGWRETALWLLGRRRRMGVDGSSMHPTLRDGDQVLVAPRAYRHRTPAPGEVVALRHPYRQGVVVIKRVQRVDDDGRMVVLGDNAEASTDSRSFGRPPLDHLVGRVTSLLGTVKSRG